MRATRLRVFPRPETDDLRIDEDDDRVPVRLADLYPLLAQAYRDNFVWLRDFEEDQVLISPDFFEVVRAFGDCRPSA